MCHVQLLMAFWKHLFAITLPDLVNVCDENFIYWNTGEFFTANGFNHFESSILFHFDISLLFIFRGKGPLGMYFWESIQTKRLYVVYHFNCIIKWNKLRLSWKWSEFELLDIVLTCNCWEKIVIMRIAATPLADITLN